MITILQAAVALCFSALPVDSAGCIELFGSKESASQMSPRIARTYAGRNEQRFYCAKTYSFHSEFEESYSKHVRQWALKQNVDFRGALYNGLPNNFLAEHARDLSEIIFAVGMRPGNGKVSDKGRDMMTKLQGSMGYSFPPAMRRSFRDPEIIQSDLAELQMLSNMRDSNATRYDDFRQVREYLDLLKSYMSKREYGEALRVVWASEGFAAWDSSSYMFTRNVVIDQIRNCKRGDEVTSSVISLRALEYPFKCNESKIRSHADSMNVVVNTCLDELFGVVSQNKLSRTPRLQITFRYFSDTRMPDPIRKVCK